MSDNPARKIYTDLLKDPTKSDRQVQAAYKNYIKSLQSSLKPIKIDE
jgi:hypothetical protein